MGSVPAEIIPSRLSLPYPISATIRTGEEMLRAVDRNVVSQRIAEYL
jgi:hypothetical protein